jgi:hypothetical protein
MYKKSTETPDKQQAIVFAKKWYLELKNKELQQLPLTETQSHVFEKVCLSLLKVESFAGSGHGGKYGVTGVLTSDILRDSWISHLGIAGT